MNDQPDGGAEPVVTALPGASLSPVSAFERIAELDVLRGVAVLGILVANIAYMAFPTDTVDVWWWEELSLPDRLVRAGVEFFAEMKFITLFSVLFGMGLALQQVRAERAGRAFNWFYIRRLTILLVIGIVHGTLLWEGDILAAYALIGVIALCCSRFSTRLLFGLVLVLTIVPLVVIGAMAALDPESFAVATTDWSSEAEALRQEYASGEEADRLTEFAIRFYEFMAREEQVYRDGTFREIVLYRTAMFLGGLLIMMLTFSWRILAMFLLGICLVRWGMFVDPAWPSARYKWLVVIGLLLGLPLQAAALAMRVVTAGEALPVFLQIAFVYVGSLGMAASYAGAVGL